MRAVLSEGEMSTGSGEGQSLLESVVSSSWEINEFIIWIYVQSMGDPKATVLESLHPAWMAASP